MNYSILYSSATGNTALLAQQLKEHLPSQNCDHFGTVKDAPVPPSPLVFVGFWTDKGTCDEQALTFLKKLHGKQIALFGTAGFGKAPSYFEQILDRIKQEIPADNQVLDCFMCQGKMPAPVRKRYEQMLQEDPSNARAQMLLENFDQALPHPDLEDLRALFQWAQHFQLEE